MFYSLRAICLTATVLGTSDAYAAGLAALQNQSHRTICSFETVVQDGDDWRTTDRLGEFRAQWGRRFGRPMSAPKGGKMKLIGYACNRGGGPIVNVQVPEAPNPYEIVLYEGEKRPELAPKVEGAEQRFDAVDKPQEAGSIPFQVTNRSKHPICRVLLMHENFDLESVGIGPGTGIYQKAFPEKDISPGHSALFFLKNRGRFGVRLVACDNKRWVYRSNDLTIGAGGLELVLGKKKVTEASPVPVFAGLPSKVVGPNVELCGKYALRTTKGDDRCKSISNPAERERCLDATQHQVQIGDPERVCADLMVNAVKKIPLR